MNKKLSMLICGLLSLVMIFSFGIDYDVFAMDFVADNPGPYGLAVGNVIVTEANKDDIPITSGKAEYNPISQELTLYDAVITSWSQVHGGEIAGIFSNHTLTIQFSGDCSIDLSNASDQNNVAEGIDIEGASSFLNINRYTSGVDTLGRSLTVVAPAVNTDESLGIYCKNSVTLWNDGAKVSISGNSKCGSYGICASNLTIQECGELTVSGTCGAFTGGVSSSVDYKKYQFIISGEGQSETSWKTYDSVIDSSVIKSTENFWNSWDTINFKPVVKDSYLRQYLISHYDSDSNKALDENERGGVKTLYIDTLNSGATQNGIKDLGGLENFPNLETLTMEHNNWVTSINLSANKKLKKLDCMDCKFLTSLDVSENTALEELNCSYCKIPTLDVSKNANLKVLNCDSCTKISELDVSACKELTYLDCSAGVITKLTLGELPKLEELNCGGDYGKTECISSLDVTKCPNLKKLYCELTDVTSIDLSQNPLLAVFDAFYTNLSTLDVTHNPELTTLRAYGDLTKIDLSKNTKLTNIEIDAKLANINLTKNTELTSLSLVNCPIKKLDVSKNTKLKNLEVENSGIASLDITNNSELTYICVKENKSLKVLDISGCSQLTEAWLYNNALTKLVLGKHDNLVKFSVKGNKLTQLDISGLPLGKEKTTYKNPYNYALGNQADDTAIDVYTSYEKIENVKYWINSGAKDIFGISLKPLSLSAPIVRNPILTSNGVDLSWTVIPGVETYEVKYKSGSGSYKTYGIFTADSCSVTGLVSDDKYTFTVTAIAADGSESGVLTNSILYYDLKILGDVDNNGSVTVDDARLALRASLKKTSTGYDFTDVNKREFFSADADRNGAISLDDARKILRVAIGTEKF